MVRLDGSVIASWLSCLIDFMIEASPAVSRIYRNRVGFFGFSAGRSTGLELAGAEPKWSALMRICLFANPTAGTRAGTMG